MRIKTQRGTSGHIHLVGASLGAVVISLSGYAVYTSWESRKSGIESTQIKLTQITTQLSESQRDRGRLVNQISNLQSIVDEQDDLPKPSTINELAIKIVALAEEYNLQLEQFDPSTSIEVDGDSVVPITLRLTAPYGSLISWLDQIHAVMPDIHVVGIAINSQSTATTVVGSDIRLHWYNPTLLGSD